MNAVADPQLRLDVRPRMRQVDLSIVAAQPTLLAAIKLCITIRGFEVEKQLVLALEIDSGHWTRIMRGEAHFPVDKLSMLMDLCENEAPMLWLLVHRGYDALSLRPIETELQQKVRLLEEELARKDREHEIEMRGVLRAQGLR